MCAQAVAAAGSKDAKHSTGDFLMPRKPKRKPSKKCLYSVALVHCKLILNTTSSKAATCAVLGFRKVVSLYMILYVCNLIDLYALAYWV